jgi:hypothetical protein
MLQKDNKIELKVGDVIRFNRARKHHKIVNMFEYEGKTYFTYTPIGEYPSFHTTSKDVLCGVYTFYGNVYDGVVEVNGYTVRGIGGKILSTPKPVQEKVKKDTTKKELTDFQKFFNVQCSGRINMTDIVTGSRLAGISEQKYEDILFHYDEYKSGKRQ